MGILISFLLFLRVWLLGGKVSVYLWMEMASSTHEAPSGIMECAEKAPRINPETANRDKRQRTEPSRKVIKIPYKLNNKNFFI